MGSWGVRMRESDAALDGIYRIEHEYPPSAPFTWEILKWYFEHGLGEEFEPRTWDIEKPKDDINPADDWADDFSDYGHHFNQEVLGIAEWLLEKDIDLKPALLQLLRAIGEELCPETLRCWQSSEERQSALEQFRDRLKNTV